MNHESKPGESSRAQPFDFGVALDVAAFRSALARADYTEAALVGLGAANLHSGSLDVPLVRFRLEAGTAFDRMVQLFYLGDALEADRVRRLFEPLPVELLVRFGLLRQTGDGLASTVKLVPYGELLMAGDFPPRDTPGGFPPDHVLGVGAASATLASLTPRRPVRSVLDVGTGSGVQALYAARHADRVVATDTNERALAFGRLAARLNGLEQIEWRAGSFFEPAGEERFDLVISNPPFVISPEHQFVFRDGGLGGDVVSEQVLRGAGRHLAEGGIAILLMHWYHGSEQDWAERPTRWLDGIGCDGWLLCFRTQEPLAYAAEWIRPTEPSGGEGYRRRLEQWRVYLRQLGADRISAGACVLRRRTARENWVRSDVFPSGLHIGPCGDQILQILASEDFLRGLASDRALLDHRFAVHPEHVAEQRLQAEPGGWSVKSMTLKATRGLSFGGELDAVVLRLLALCDGTRPLGEAVSTLATLFEVELGTLTLVCLEAVKRLLRSGLLVAAPRGESTG